jgi:dipeptidyl aminopeptidase/acylaminoacyl peptidase
LKKTFLIVILFFLNTYLFADAPALIPRQILFDIPSTLDLTLSPDGKKITYYAPHNGVSNIWIKTVGKNDDRPLTNFDKQTRYIYNWTFDNRHILITIVVDNNNINIFKLDTLKKKAKLENMTPFKNISAYVVKLSPSRPNLCLIRMNKSDQQVFDVYTLNLKTGNISMTQKNPGNIYKWYATEDLQIVGAALTTRGNNMALLHRNSNEDMWESILQWTTKNDVVPVCYDSTKENLFVIHNLNSDLSKLYKFNIKTRKSKVVFESAKTDVEQFILNATETAPIAIAEYYLRQKWNILDKTYQQDFQIIEQAQDADFYISGRSHDDNIWMITYTSSTKPVLYYLYYRRDKILTPLTVHRPELNKYILSSKRPVIIKNRDGMDMVGYLTLPSGVKEKNLPFIINPAHYVWGRYYAEFDTIPQFFANRGYAILQINTRGSYGFGKKYLESGNKEWGNKMLDDIEDAVNWAIQQNIADPERIAAFGLGVGGFQALSFSYQKPGILKAVVVQSAPLNLISFLENLPPSWKQHKAIFLERFGNPDEDEKMLKKVSPYYNGFRIRVPVLMIQGTDTSIIDEKETKKLAKRIKKNRTAIIALIFKNEGYNWFIHPANAIASFGLTELFLSNYLVVRV